MKNKKIIYKLAIGFEYTRNFHFDAKKNYDFFCPMQNLEFFKTTLQVLHVLRGQNFSYNRTQERIKDF